jgi:protein SCO1/2
MNKSRLFRILTVFVGMTALGLGIGFYIASYHQPTKPDVQGLLWPDPKQLRAFATIDHNGRVFSIDRLQGKWSFLFFGFTHCPDVCPLTLAVLNDFYNRIQGTELARGTQIIFVTVDPERDTSERVRDYVGYFNPAFIGLGGNMDQIISLSSQLGVFFMHGEKTGDGGYSVDHTAAVFLIDPLGRVVAVFSAPHQVDSFRDRYTIIRKFIEKQSTT